MVTTIQLGENIKSELAKMKTSPNETYEGVIIKMIENNEKQKRFQRGLLIEGCKVMAKDSLKITKEFEYADSELNEEW